MTDIPSPTPTVAMAEALLGEGRLEEAAQIYRLLLDQDYSPATLHMLGYIAQQSAQYEGGVDYCRRAIALGLDTWTVHLALGACLYALGRMGEAYDALLCASLDCPTREDAAGLLLETAILVHGIDHARDLYERMFRGLGIDAIDRSWLCHAFENGGGVELNWPGLHISAQARARDWGLAQGLPVLYVGDIEDIPVEDPRAGTRGGAAAMTIPSNAPYVAALPDVTIFAQSHIVLTNDDVALNEAGAHPDYGVYVSHASDRAVIGQRPGALLIDVAGFRVRELDAGIMLCGPASDAWGHWAAEYLPRLQFLEQHPDFASLPIIIDAGLPQSHLDHLALLVSNPLLELKPGEGLRCGKLLYAPPPTFFPIHLLPNDIPLYAVCAASPRAYRFLKERVEAKLGVRPPGCGKYYLSRRNRGWRRIRNDSEVTAFLEARGFQTVMMEDLTFEQQVRVFQDAASIVAPNGSSLQNIVFAPPGVQLIVLNQTNPHNIGAFNGQARALGYRPRFVWGPATGDEGQKHVDYAIPLDELAAALGAAGDD